YSEKGFYILLETLHKMFSQDDYPDERYKPLPWQAAVEEILLPEAAVMLIMQDRNITEDEARHIHVESQVFGLHTHP
ncbi:hypothetical protein DFP72DRAFT_776430, partial [Ephemerocybe angulata]